MEGHKNQSIYLLSRNLHYPLNLYFHYHQVEHLLRVDILQYDKDLKLRLVAKAISFLDFFHFSEIDFHSHLFIVFIFQFHDQYQPVKNLLLDIFTFISSSARILTQSRDPVATAIYKGDRNRYSFA